MIFSKKDRSHSSNLSAKFSSYQLHSYISANRFITDISFSNLPAANELKSLQRITLLLQISCFVLPPLFGYVAYRIALMLKRAEEPAEEPAPRPTVDAG